MTFVYSNLVSFKASFFYNLQKMNNSLLQLIFEIEPIK